QSIAVSAEFMSFMRCLFVSQCIFFFFFQAEDGIRDLIVTGVQTCALPILKPPCQSTCRTFSVIGKKRFESAMFGSTAGAMPRTRSEERRVGKECRSGWWP